MQSLKDLLSSATKIGWMASFVSTVAYYAWYWVPQGYEVYDNLQQGYIPGAYDIVMRQRLSQ